MSSDALLEKEVNDDDDYSNDSFVSDEDEVDQVMEKSFRGKTAPPRRRTRLISEGRARTKGVLREGERLRSKKHLVPVKIDPDVFGEPRNFGRKAAPPVDSRGRKLGLTDRRQYVRQKKKMRDRLRSVRSTLNNRLHPAVDRKFATRKRGERRKQRVGVVKSRLGPIKMTKSIRGEEFKKPVLVDVAPVRIPSRDEEKDASYEIILTEPPPLSPTQRRAASASASRRVSESEVRSNLLPLVLELCKVMSLHDPDSFGIIRSEDLEESIINVYGESIGAASRMWVLRKFVDREGLVDYSEVAEWIGGSGRRQRHFEEDEGVFK